MAGVITDGDLRRGLHKWGAGLFGMKAAEVMTRNPRMISRDTLAAKALSLMQQYSITALIVPDEESRPAGVIHLHDILKKGIV
ncbi:MAG TPA: CBS domain-containing protein [Nitrospirae bacterium]|nr:CBS domain-containing protein [Nitrospirota bacterium]